jgi:hypothetical protein
MTIPALILGILISTLYGAFFHVIRGGNIFYILFYVILSWVGFWLGQFLAMRLSWTFLSIGPLHLGMATITAIALLLLGSWLFTFPKDFRSMRK